MDHFAGLDVSVIEKLGTGELFRGFFIAFGPSNFDEP